MSDEKGKVEKFNKLKEVNKKEFAEKKTVFAITKKSPPNASRKRILLMPTRNYALIIAFIRACFILSRLQASFTPPPC